MASDFELKIIIPYFFIRTTYDNLVVIKKTCVLAHCNECMEMFASCVNKSEQKLNKTPNSRGKFLSPGRHSNWV